MADRSKAGRGVDLAVPRRRFLLVALAVVLSLLVSIHHIRSVGRVMSYRLDDLAGSQLTAQDVTVTPEGMVRVLDVTYDGDIPVLELEGVNQGAGMILVNAGDMGMMFEAEVKPGPVVVTDSVNFTGWEAVGWSLAASFLVAALVCLWNLVWLWRRSWYGYAMAANAGLALFCAFQAVVFLQVMISGDAHEFYDLVMLIISASDRFVWLALPVVAVCALLVSASNVVLIRREGRSVTNLLGVAFGVALAMAVLAWRALASLQFDTYAGTVAAVGINSIVATAISFGMALFLGTSACALAAALHKPAMPRDFLIVLGCGLRADGTPTPLLAGRVDTARAYARAQRDAGHAAPTFVTSGGKGDDEPCAEAESMRRYLAQTGVDDAHIVVEDQSTNTRENFSLSAKKIAAAWGDRPSAPRIAFSTTNYHVFRSYVFAHEAGLAAEGIAAPTKVYFWPNAFLREFVGLLVARFVPLLLALLAISSVYLAGEYIVLLG